MTNEKDRTKPEVQTLTIEGATFETVLTQKFLGRKPWVPRDPRMVTCVIPGVVLKVHVKPGQAIRKGDPLLVLEAMKMQNDVLAPTDGKVRTIAVTQGQQVPKGSLLVELS